MKVKVKSDILFCLHKSDSWPEALHNCGSGSWLAWANATAAHYAAIRCSHPCNQQIYRSLKQPHEVWSVWRW